MKHVKQDQSLATRHLEYILPIIHFLVSFLWEKAIFIYDQTGKYSDVIARSTSVISDRSETILIYILCRVFCFIIIWYLWKLFFAVVHHKVSGMNVIIFGSILITGLLIGLFLYPDTFGIEIDNFTNFLHIRRFEATYWQSIYTGALYGGCFMVLPHPAALFIFQWMFFWFVISYICVGLELISGKKWIKFIPLLFFLLPESFYLAFNAYRNNYYTVLVLFYISYLFFNAIQKKSDITIWNIAWFSALSAFIMVWRSEGILIGAGGLFAYILLLLPHEKASLFLKKAAVLLACSLVAFLAMHKVQGIGNEKYYGQDYMILNTTRVLYSILNDPGANLSYEGSEDDLAAIEKIVPVAVLREQGIKGFRKYNWTNGRHSFNQTLATDEDASSYMRAYYRIISNNKGDFLSVQLNSFCSSLGLPVEFETYSFTGEKTVKLEKYVYDKWKLGKKEVMATWKTSGWNNYPARVRVSEAITKRIISWEEKLGKTKVNPMLHVLALIIDAVLLAVLLIRRILGAGNTRGELGFIVAFLVILSETAAILLFMPEGRPTYMYPMLYASYLTIFYLFTYFCLNRRMKAARDKS